ncbi:MAG: hypothetical protein DHS20C18_35230 [Saprospiraceae bacterium]|nr:MAG: hypothetical protein DHS20C18_35230 [Saprospiraceae bacterium]
MLLLCLREATAKQGAESFAKDYGRARRRSLQRKLQRKRMVGLQTCSQPLTPDPCPLTPAP